MTDANDGVPPEAPEAFLAGSEAISDDEDTAKGASQAIQPSGLEEPALLNGTSGGARTEEDREDDDGD